MIDRLLPGDITLLAFGCALLFVFFFSGTHKIYESIIGSLLGICLFFVTSVFQGYMTPETTNNMLDSFVLTFAPTIQSFALILTLVLLVLCPFLTMLQVHSRQTSQLWQLSKAIVYTIFYLFYFLAILSLVIYGPGPFARNNFFTAIQGMSWWNTYIANSSIFRYAIQNAYTILFVGIVFVIAKMLLGSIIDRIILWITIVLLTVRNLIVNIVSRGKVKWKTNDEVITHGDDGDE